jgi:hypothetical protein
MDISKMAARQLGEMFSLISVTELSLKRAALKV